MLVSRGLPLALIPPKLPDRWLCSPTYGRPIDPAECSVAVDFNWPYGKTPIPYYAHDPSPSNTRRLPQSNKQGSCQVTIESAGPGEWHPEFLSVSADDMRGMAGWIINKCAVENNGIGGFITVGIQSTETYVQRLTDDWTDKMANSTDGNHNNGAFLTISIIGKDRTLFAPGNTDPNIAGYLTRYAAYSSMLFVEKLYAYQALAVFFHDRTVSMIQGGGGSWWSTLGTSSQIQGSQQDASNGRSSQTAANGLEALNNGGSISNPSHNKLGLDAGEMTYQCDGNLGTGEPVPIDCEKLSWSGLSHDVDEVVELRKGAPKFWSEGTCTLALSSSTGPTTIITWAHILAAFNTLNNLCVQNPIRAIKGGRAYYGQQTMSSWITGKKKEKKLKPRKVKGRKSASMEEEQIENRRDVGGEISGDNALPPGVEVMIFRNVGPGKLNCEWALAQEGKDTSMCERG